MPFIKNIEQYKSLAIVGLEKNTGKTECLNYILNRIKPQAEKFAITSIGIDGEKNDQVTQTEKPEIELPKGITFITSEKHYRERTLLSEIIDLDNQQTALGRLITAKVKAEGKILLSGPATTYQLKKNIENIQWFGVKTTIVDGALSRLSLASPAVTDALILATGAAVSTNIPKLISITAFAHKLIQTPPVEFELMKKLEKIQNGLWAIDDNGEIFDLKIPSVFLLEKYKQNIFNHGNRIYVAGAVSDNLLNFFRIQKQNIELIIRDFTKVFASQSAFDMFVKKGGKIKSVFSSKLLALTINPQAPSGYKLNSDKLKNEMQKSLQIPVYDVRKLG